MNSLTLITIENDGRLWKSSNSEFPLHPQRSMVIKIHAMKEIKFYIGYCSIVTRSQLVCQASGPVPDKPTWALVSCALVFRTNLNLLYIQILRVVTDAISQVIWYVPSPVQREGQLVKSYPWMQWQWIRRWIHYLTTCVWNREMIHKNLELSISEICTHITADSGASFNVVWCEKWQEIKWRSLAWWGKTSTAKPRYIYVECQSQCAWGKMWFRGSGLQWRGTNQSWRVGGAGDL